MFILGFDANAAVDFSILRSSHRMKDETVIKMQ
jgi:hypothetical protein